ncbi:hypothetical protein TSUD_313170 [Trifolium subterraneum]|uniref:Uncharacterized protein n=1 Tax=Trifolium subterraneum TaxID=3900 RepID=A0A2Z6M9G7_TRISU|nr:hypothetical protein TSUD_313170 [Trifolium subterraneum]
MGIITTPKAYPLESVGSSTTGTVTHCDDERRSNSSNDDEASSSCNFRPVKRRRMDRSKERRKVFRTMAVTLEDPPVVFRERLQEDPYEHDWQELSLEEKRIRCFAELLYSHNPSKQLFDAAAETLKDTHLVKKSLSDCFFGGAECDIISKKLHKQHNIAMPYTLVGSNLNAAYYAFEEYCLLMKRGREGLHFDRETGKVYIQGTYSTDDPIVEKHANIKRTHMDAILNFNSLKAIFPFLWDKYFKDGSKKRSGSSMLGSSRLRELFGNGPNKRLTKAYVDAATLHYGKDEIACCAFLAYEDDDAKAAFASKTNIDIQI